MGGDITSHLITVSVPQMNGKLDFMSAQAEETGAKMLKEMNGLQEKIRRLNSTTKSNGGLLLAMEKWFSDRQAITVQRQCLRTLYCNEIDSRKAVVKEAHKETFRWVLDER
ncbi:hypothetical protein K458DRAFT_393740 [Lentithecium fluviatile CBS 122367]|uniref:Uncharacterized protein n=1 Tax=Lentithecium fluviatile CBS 122367 TaxID=1168545 RepID=A0A6G1IN92_9PLEO|nr:hypothetical protein K458DRAFT_393740 [Lentithecium fluviatile CBS 122367]